jgi:hypothetical protein
MIDKPHKAQIENVRQFIQDAFRCQQVNDRTDIDTELAFEYDGISRHITIARVFFDNQKKDDIAYLFGSWKLVETVLVAEGRTVYVGEDGISVLQ